jgi:hypothetical protein
MTNFQELPPDLPPLQELVTTAAGTAVMGFPSGGLEAAAQWKKLYAARLQTGLYPILLSPDLDEYFEFGWEKADAEEILGEAAGLDGQALLESRADSFGASDESEASPPYDGEETPSAPGVLRLAYRSDGLAVALVQCAEPWQIPAQLGLGNEGWKAAEQVAILRYLHELYGAVPVTLSAKCLELALERPPQTDEDALTAARLYFAYNDGAYDNYWSTTTRNLAMKLKGNSVWTTRFD